MSMPESIPQTFTNYDEVENFFIAPDALSEADYRDIKIAVIDDSEFDPFMGHFDHGSKVENTLRRAHLPESSVMMFEPEPDLEATADFINTLNKIEALPDMDLPAVVSMSSFPSFVRQREVENKARSLVETKEFSIRGTFVTALPEKLRPKAYQLQHVLKSVEAEDQQLWIELTQTMLRLRMRGVTFVAAIDNRPSYASKEAARDIFPTIYSQAIRVNGVTFPAASGDTRPLEADRLEEIGQHDMADVTGLSLWTERSYHKEGNSYATPMMAAAVGVIKAQLGFLGPEYVNSLFSGAGMTTIELNILLSEWTTIRDDLIIEILRDSTNPFPAKIYARRELNKYGRMEFVREIGEANVVDMRKLKQNLLDNFATYYQQFSDKLIELVSKAADTGLQY